MGLVGWGRRPTPATAGPVRRRRSSDPLCDCPPFAVTVDRRGLPSWTMLTTTMLTTLLTSRTRKGVESTQSDERGRTAMTEDAWRWVRFADLRLGMLTSPIILTPSEGGLHGARCRTAGRSCGQQ